MSADRGFALAGFALLAAALPAVALAAPAPAFAFPSPPALFGGAEDPLETLAQGGDLRDSVAGYPSIMTLQRGLRSASLPERLSAVRAAARPGAAESIPHLAGVLLRLDEPARLRAAAALGLGRVGGRLAERPLAEALRDPSPEVRYAAALALGSLDLDGTATRLERVLRSDSDWRPRYGAAIGLGRLGRTFAAPSLIRALADDPSWEVRQQAARSLQRLGAPAALRHLLGALADPEPGVRGAAALALADAGGASARDALRAALEAERDPSLRSVLVVALGRALR